MIFKYNTLKELKIIVGYCWYRPIGKFRQQSLIKYRWQQFNQHLRNPPHESYYLILPIWQVCQFCNRMRHAVQCWIKRGLNKTFINMLFNFVSIQSVFTVIILLYGICRASPTNGPVTIETICCEVCGEIGGEFVE